MCSLYTRPPTISHPMRLLQPITGGSSNIWWCHHWRPGWAEHSEGLEIRCHGVFSYFSKSGPNSVAILQWINIPFGWIGMLNASQTFSSADSSWPHKHCFGCVDKFPQTHSKIRDEVVIAVKAGPLHINTHALPIKCAKNLMARCSHSINPLLAVKAAVSPDFCVSSTV